MVVDTSDKDRSKCSTTFYVCTCVLGLTLLLAGLIVLFFVYPKLITEGIDKNLVLRNGSDAADRFVKPASNVYFKVYLFNVTNKDDVNNGSDAELQQLGPYVFREEKVKVVSAWDEETGTVRYRVKSTYRFDDEKSEGKLSDVVNHINAVSIGMISLLDSLGMGDAVPQIKGNYVETHTADELIFTGYNMSKYCPDDLVQPCQSMDNCMFAYYYGKNESIGEEYEVSSGVDGMENYTYIASYATEKELSYWHGDTCNMINGTDGQQFPPHVDEDSALYLFSSDVCRSMMFTFEQKVTVQRLKALRYTIPDIVFADPNMVEDNMCFCQDVSSNQSCPSKAGVMSLKTCQGGRPVVASNPHFYQGDPEYWMKYEGLNPNKDEHETYLDVEPLTGTVIAAKKRIQINIQVARDSRVKFLNHVTDVTYFPAFWIEEGGEIDADSAASFRRQVIVLDDIGHWGSITAIGAGGLIFLVASCVFYCKRKQTTKAYYTKFHRDEVYKQTTNEKGAISKTSETYGAT